MVKGEVITERVQMKCRGDVCLRLFLDQKEDDISIHSLIYRVNNIQKVLTTHQSI